MSYILVDIAIVRSANSIVFDPRVKKIAGSLRKKYSLLALGWDRQGISNEMTNNDAELSMKLFKLRTSFWKPSLMRMVARLLIFFPLFWSWLIAELFISRPAVVHACDLDTVIPCYIYKKILRKKLVFDIFDRYAMVFVPPKYKTFYRMVNCLEEKFCHRTNAVIVAGGEKVIHTFRTKPPHCVAVLNCPEDYRGIETTSQTRENDGPLMIAYTGGIRRGRGLECMGHILDNISKVELVVAGPVMDKKVLEDIRDSSHIRYKGNLRPQDAIELELESDVIIALYDPEVPWNMITLPNKLFEAMMCGIPIITNIATEIVNETQCGIIVDYNDAEQIERAIINLRDKPPLRKWLGDNGRKAFLEKYNWGVMEEKLYKVYENLL
jgi:glycosyltransferase involved in cell wall biosynthesis